MDFPAHIVENEFAFIAAAPGELVLPKPIRAKITALGTYVPPRVLTNQDLEKMVETTDQWILERTGIRERHLVDKGSRGQRSRRRGGQEAGAVASPRSCRKSTSIVVGTVTPDMMYPSTACLVQHKLGITRTWGYDLSAGCSGFLYALNAGTQFIESGRYKKVLVIGSDVNSIMTDYTDRAVCIIFGDGAGAVLLEPAGRGRRRNHRLRGPDRRRWRRVSLHARGRQFESRVARNS